jgi:hypothetical protein
VAIRLAEPEGFSTDAVLTMSQAVRRRPPRPRGGPPGTWSGPHRWKNPPARRGGSPPRRGELETLVRGEISTLERAYSDNEIRIRTLVDELVAAATSRRTAWDMVRTASVEKPSGSARRIATSPTALQGAIGAAAVLAPVMLFYIAAMLAVRAQEMRLVARSTPSPTAATSRRTAWDMVRTASVEKPSGSARRIATSPTARATRRIRRRAGAGAGRRARDPGPRRDLDP